MGKESHSRAPLECVGTIASNKTYESHYGTENKPARTPWERKIDFAKVVRIEKGMIIEMAICP